VAVAEPYVSPIPAGRLGRVADARSRLGEGSRLGVFGLGLAGVVTLVAVAVPVLAPHGALETVGPSFRPPSAHFWLGTDEIGRDVLSRTLYGVRSTWVAAAAVILSGVVIGGLVGLVAGMRGGWVDTVLMRITDMFLALPGALVAVAIVAAMGPSLRNTLIAVGVFWWPYYARIVRGEVRALMARPFIEAARLARVGPVRLMFRHLTPGLVPPVLVAATLDVGALVLILAGLSFIGLGAPPPSPELGAMAARGQQFLLTSWWVAVAPGVAVFVLALAANLAGDGVRDLVEA
jgi:peptide/nickel transport system permease protein